MVFMAGAPSHIDLFDPKPKLNELHGQPLPESLTYQSDDSAALADAQLLVSAVPCQFLRSVWSRLKPHVPAGIPIVSITKGIELSTLLRPTQILTEILRNQR